MAFFLYRIDLHATFPAMKLFLNLILLILILLSAYSCSRKNELPAYSTFPDAALQEPIQRPTQRLPFTADINDQTHSVHPLFEYQIAGMVVSCGFSKSLAEYRNDELNIMDAGLIWGSNLDPDLYQHIKFETNGAWLTAKTKDRTIWEKLNSHKLSNNHLICTDPELIKQIKSIKRGDIVSIKGYLASYSGRKCSTSRTDIGDHACEVIWVEEFKTLSNGPQHWQRLNRAGLIGIAGVLLIQLLRFIFIRPNA